MESILSRNIRYLEVCQLFWLRTGTEETIILAERTQQSELMKNQRLTANLKRRLPWRCSTHPIRVAHVLETQSKGRSCDDRSAAATTTGGDQREILRRRARLPNKPRNAIASPSFPGLIDRRSGCSRKSSCERISWSRCRNRSCATRCPPP
jgi:hypothetical protein